MLLSFLTMAMGSVNAVTPCTGVTNSTLAYLCNSLSAVQLNQTGANSIVLITNSLNTVTNTVNSLSITQRLQSNQITQIATNQVNFTTFNSVLTRINGNYLNLNSTIDNLTNVVVDAKDSSVSALNSVGTIQTTSTQAINKANEALVGLAGLQNTSQENIDTVNQNVTNVQKLLNPILALNLTAVSGNRPIQDSISWADLKADIGIFLGLVSLILTIYLNIYKKRDTDTFGKVLTAEQEAKARAELERRKNEEKNKAMETQKLSEEEIAKKRVLMTADPKYQELKKNFLADKKKLDKTGVSVSPTSLSTFKPLQEKMAEYGFDLGADLEGK